LPTKPGHFGFFLIFTCRYLLDASFLTYIFMFRSVFELYKIVSIESCDNLGVPKHLWLM
jgi:hypothetical protein